jgi:cytidylate kinase
MILTLGEGYGNMDNNTIITIGRQYGSGGHKVGKLLAEGLGIPFYDKELIAVVAKKSGFDKELFEKADEKTTSGLLNSLIMGTHTIGNTISGVLDVPLNDKLFLIQADIIKDIAKEGSCVIVGRCADYILNDVAPCVNVFIHANMQSRIDRAVDEYNVPKAKAESIISKIDKQRANYHNYYANSKWGRAENYDLCIDTSAISIENAAELIKNFVKMKEEV